MCEALDLTGDDNFSPQGKASQIFLLKSGKGMRKHSAKQIEEAEDDTTEKPADDKPSAKVEKDEYEELFEKIFQDNYRKMQILHRFSVMNINDIIQILATEESFLNETNDQEIKNMYKWVFYEFCKKYLSMTNDDIKWFKSLARVALKDVHGFNYLAQQYELGALKTGLYK